MHAASTSARSLAHVHFNGEGEQYHQTCERVCDSSLPACEESVSANVGCLLLRRVSLLG